MEDTLLILYVFGILYFFFSTEEDEGWDFKKSVFWVFVILEQLYWALRKYRHKK